MSDLTHGPELVVINVGNTRTQVALAHAGVIDDVVSIPNEDRPATLEAINARWVDVRDDANAAIVVASVNAEVSEALTSAVRDQLSVEVVRIDEDVPVPIPQRLEPETMTGADRLLSAIAAYELVEQAVVVVDAGTAITVDFIDGEGTFHGGAIAPGARLQLGALHDHTSALPLVEFQPPDDEAFGGSTNQAMLQGVYHGLRGMVWRLVERYAEAYGAYPLVVATGGDAEVLFEDDELIDRIVPDLTLRGMVSTVRQALPSRRPDGDARG